MFEGAGGGGADGDDSAILTEGQVDGLRGAGGEGVGLGVEADVGEVFDANGLEGAEAYVEGEGLDLDAVDAELSEDLGGEVEAGGGGGGGAEVLRVGVLGIDGLIAVAVDGGVGGVADAVDVGGQGHVADLVDTLEEVGELEGT